MGGIEARAIDRDKLAVIKLPVTTNMTITTSDTVSEIGYLKLLDRLSLERQRSKDALWSAVCVMVLLVLVIWAVLYTRLYLRRSKRYFPCDFNTTQTVAVLDVVRSKARYLPMFQYYHQKHQQSYYLNFINSDLD